MRQHQDKAFRHAFQFAVRNDRRAAVFRICRYQLIGKSDPPAKLDRRRNVGDEAVGTLLNEKAVLPHGAKNATQSIGRFKQRNFRLRRKFRQPVHRGQPGNAAADDSNFGAAIWGNVHRKW